jgi:prephenate dehydrogenase
LFQTPSASSPDAEINRAALRVERFWKAVGGRWSAQSGVHDVLVSRSSHCRTRRRHAGFGGPDPRQPKQLANLCANGFRDTTRVASGSAKCGVTSW